MELAHEHDTNDSNVLVCVNILIVFLQDRHLSAVRIDKVLCPAKLSARPFRAHTRPLRMRKCIPARRLSNFSIQNPPLANEYPAANIRSPTYCWPAR